ncbi:hypothetical protein G6O67_007251 [Ophiocordyceps sinensis]|uniref:ribonuclease H n=1 Tax=Ophiocordyceps sinensis TaxID=72228 RepID=A0A8H4PLD4_9HYPO|nr:hypothetical protein G6O67_007251 [Ophiocordyceps sinensis]
MRNLGHAFFSVPRINNPDGAFDIGRGELFPPGIGLGATPFGYRFIRRQDSRQALIYVDGACLDNGRANPKAGWAFVFKPETAGTAPHRGNVSGRLEKKGPFGDEYGQTSNRAELRAVLGALRFRHWEGEGFTTLVIATDSEYVAEGATTDLWEALLGEFERWDSWGLKIEFWRIPRTLNVVADGAAKRAADAEDVEEYLEVNGVLV